MDARRAPEGVRGGHPSDESLDLGVDGRATSACTPRQLSPVLAEAIPLPQHGVGGPNDEGVLHPSPDLGQPDPEEAIGRAKLGPARRSPVHGELPAQGEVLEDELVVAAAKEGEETEQVEQGGHH